ncbi:hypothetical protein ACAG25_24350 [Mycobacterium sp. pV006]|uniref:hypothetical protein n=1 Tax=Mycobacterium sp. pV006 TaxID=3238983 RepID=UPI00351BB0C4
MTYLPPGSIPPSPGLPSPRRGKPWLWVALAVAVVIIIVLATLLVTQSSDDTEGQPTAADPAQTSAVPLTPPPTTEAPRNSEAGSSMTCDGLTASVDATSQPGWRATINRYRLAYAAPPDWTVAACGVRTGWAQPCPQGQCVIQELEAVATVANPACTKQNLAVAGVTRSRNPEIGVALDQTAETVTPIYTRDGQAPAIEFGPVREFSIGPHPAVQMVATVTGIAATECTGPTAYHSIVVTTVPKVEGSVVFVISLREGSTVKPNPDVINQMVDTLRSPAE